MDGIHDLGGKHGFGAVKVEPQQTHAFAARWEAKVFTMVNMILASRPELNVDYFRHAVERIDPVGYLTHGYYGRWLGAAETMLVESGVLSQAQITERAVALGADPDALVAARPNTGNNFNAGAGESSVSPTAQRESSASAKFQPGDKVRTRSTASPGHTRLPAYARGMVGEVTALHGTWVYPDSNAHGHGEAPIHLYTVAFAGQDLWGDSAEPDVTVSLDLFESYLQHE